jgi:hypothetical protein
MVKLPKTETTTTAEPETPKVEAPAVATQGNLAVAPKPAELPKFDRTTLDGCKSISAKVRYLHACGFTRGQIVKVFPSAVGRTILYQHVRNVLIQPVKSAQ